MEQTPMSNALYRSLAKDFQPKPAMMNMCKYIMALEARVAALEAKEPIPFTEEPAAEPAKRGRKPKTETPEDGVTE